MSQIDGKGTTFIVMLISINDVWEIDDRMTLERLLLGVNIEPFFRRCVSFILIWDFQILTQESH